MTCNRERLNERIFALLNLTAALRQKAIHQLDQAPRRSPAISEGDFRESATSRMRITCWLLDVFDKRYVRLRNITETLGHVFLVAGNCTLFARIWTALAPEFGKQTSLHDASGDRCRSGSRQNVKTATLGLLTFKSFHVSWTTFTTNFEHALRLSSPCGSRKL